MTPTVSSLRESLEAVADSSIAPEMERYMRNRAPYLGIKTPVRRKTAGPWIKSILADPGAVRPLIDELWDQPEREFQYVGQDLLAKAEKHLDESDLPWLVSLVNTKSWWDTVDALAAIIGGVALDRPPMWETIDTWANSTGKVGDDEPAMWLARCAILQQLRYKERTEEAVLFDRCLRRVQDKEFFIRKAIGWSLRQYARTSPESVRVFVAANRHEMSPLSIREATKHL
ncbi:MAG: DNA alkylation repair protein [Actinomycetia bacterium]|nr:DNA alkylation repair protein [Actinomycetes bacterium]MCP4958607.1 DNA alkylation repair protein [Actinomycetes bacterium]